MLQKKNITKRLAFMGLMVAVEIIFERVLAVSTDTLRISVTFLPRALSGTVFGFAAAVTSVLADLIGGFLYYGLSVNPVITIAAGLKGFGYGLFLYRKRSFPRVLFAAAFDQFLCGFVITTLGLIWYGYLPMSAASFLGRLPQCGILFLVEVAVLTVLIAPYDRLKKLYEQLME